MVKLTPRREKMAVLVVGGMTQSQAFRESFTAKNYTEKMIWSEASRIMADPKVMLRVEELKKEFADKVMWKREDSIRELSEIALRKAHTDKNTGEVTPGAKDNDRIAAIKELNSMEGFNAPVKQEHTVTEKMTLADLRGKQS
jgi:phage terminase small subunit